MAQPTPRRGILLLQLGTPDGPTTPAVRRYLRQFLMDPRVVDLPFLPRWLLVNGFIAPFRAPRSAAAYRAIWTDAGSPLRVNTEALARALQGATGLPVAVGMRYGTPDTAAALAALGPLDEVVAVPLYPQYASASTGSALEILHRTLAAFPAIPALRTIGPLVSHPAWHSAVAEVARAAVTGAEAVVFSYHGLPERQVRATQPGCVLGECCNRPEAALGHCYRAHCLATTRELATLLDTPVHETAFQSRLGREAWLTPTLDATLDRLLDAGHRRIAVVSPSFVADCLETLEEVGIRARARVEARGGQLSLAPCLNAHPTWVRALAQLVAPVPSA